MGSYCQSAHNSCSACCGIYNIQLSETELKKYLVANTKKFIELPLVQAQEFVQFRADGEKHLKKFAIIQDTYSCPFIGYVDKDYARTGCLLHPEGSPHPNIKKWDHPQNFSFYGEGICQSYDCISKESILSNPKANSNDACNRQKELERCTPETNISQKSDCSTHQESSVYQKILNFLPKENLLLYGKLIANHNLLTMLNELEQEQETNIDIDKLWQLVIKYYLKTHLPISSFEITSLKKLNQFNFSNPPPLLSPINKWHILGSILEPSAYQKDEIVITKKGIVRGNAIRRLVTNEI